MSLYQSVYSDVVKDVIGDDPVVDQFDIYYEASFFGTMQDDYITGSILTFDDKKKNFTVSTGGPGTRGRAFSIYYAESQPPLGSTYGSVDVSLNPFLSKRVVPWKERSSSTAYRLRQLFDGSERYYDSCIPDIAYCLGADGSRIWTNEDPDSSVKNKTTLSPYASVVTGSNVGYMLFNAVPQDRSSEGYEIDPTTNNNWTWSFPYEGKYKPQDRLVKIDKSLNFKSNLSCRLPIYDKKEREFFGLNDTKINTDNTGSFNYRDSNEVVCDTTPMSIKETRIKKVEFFVPLLPGYNGLFRNSFRTKTTITGTLGNGKIRSAWYRNENVDRGYGHSLLVPSDVNLSSLADNGFLSNYQNAETSVMPVTQSMNSDDKIKFLFGFGDVNTITYGQRSYDSSKATLAYSLNLDDYSEGTKPNQFTSFNQDGLTINWNFTSSDGDYQHYWYIAPKKNVNPSYVQSLNKYFDYISGSVGPTTDGIAWEHVDGSSKVLVSNTSDDYGGTMGNSGDSKSPFWLDITSSYPWNFSYDRAVGYDPGSNQILEVYFAAYPGQPSDWLSKVYLSTAIPGAPSYVATTIDFVTGTTTYVTMSNYNYQENFYNTKYRAAYWNATYQNTSLGQYLLEPGEYRLIFVYSFSDAPSSGPMCAAIRNFKIFTFKEDAFPIVEGSRMGGNNYPKFKTYRIDKRLNPVLSGTVSILSSESIASNSGMTIPVSDHMISGSAETSKSIVFGISPEIRGWKYGLVSGFPTYSKAVFRRDKYGQLRDMLEQRPYAKFINVLSSPLDNDAVTSNQFNVHVDSRYEAYAEGFSNVGPPTVEVNFVKQRYRKNDKGVGYIYSEKVDPLQTYSQNLSNEVTSSLPYFDGVARHRQETDLQLVSNTNLSSIQFNSSGLTVT